MKLLRIAFAGELFSGKDHVAAQVCDVKIGFADPIYAVSRHFNGTDDKKVPGIRRFMQLVGQWGWGHVSEEPDYQHSPVRALLSSQIVALGTRGVFGAEFIGWENFGKSRTMWVDMLWNRLQKIEQSCAITNVRFPHEVEFCAAKDIPLYLVECSLETRMERLAAAGSKLTEKELKDTSEKLPGELRKMLPDHQIIWNDHRPMPDGHRYLLVPEFCEAVHHHSDDASMAHIPDPLVVDVGAVPPVSFVQVTAGGLRLIMEERVRQLAEGKTRKHDAEEHADGEIAFRAAELAMAGLVQSDLLLADPSGRAWVPDAWSLRLRSGDDRVKQLTWAGALIAAELDRLLGVKDDLTEVAQ